MFAWLKHSRCSSWWAAISSQVFVGFTDGTTVWGAAVSDRSCEFVMIDYTNPLAYAVGSSLNQFNIFNFVDNNERFNVCAFWHPLLPQFCVIGFPCRCRLHCRDKLEL